MLPHLVLSTRHTTPHPSLLLLPLPFLLFLTLSSRPWNSSPFLAILNPSLCVRRSSGFPGVCCRRHIRQFASLHSRLTCGCCDWSTCRASSSVPRLPSDSPDCADLAVARRPLRRLDFFLVFFLTESYTTFLGRIDILDSMR